MRLCTCRNEIDATQQRETRETEKDLNMSNVSFDYAAELNFKLNSRLLSDDARINDKNSANNKRMKAQIDALSDARMIDALSNENVDARDFSDNIYAIDKLVRIAKLITDKRATVADCDEKTIAMFRTSVNFYNARYTLTRDDLKCAISRSVQKDEKARNLTYKMRNAYDEEKTISTQSSSSICALESLRIISEVKRNVYALNANSFTLALCAELNLALIDDSAE